MKLHQSQQKQQKGKEGFEKSERWMLCGCVSKQTEIKINPEWWKTLDLSIPLLLISLSLKHSTKLLYRHLLPKVWGSLIPS